MNEYTFIPMRDFKRSEADESVFYVVDLNDGLIVDCDRSTTYDMFFELMETPGVYVAYKKKPVLQHGLIWWEYAKNLHEQYTPKRRKSQEKEGGK